MPLLTEHSVTYSSTYIRSCVDAGDVKAAAEALGRPHRVEGVVVRGDRGSDSRRDGPSHPAHAQCDDKPPVAEREMVDRRRAGVPGVGEHRTPRGQGGADGDEHVAHPEGVSRGCDGQVVERVDPGWAASGEPVGE